MKKINVKTCPYCGSDRVLLYYHQGVDLESNFITNYFIECMDCGTNLKSRNLYRLLLIWNAGL